MMTYNIKFASNDSKRLRIFSFLHKQRYDIIALQETHCATAAEASGWTRQWGSRAYWTTACSKANRFGGTALLFNRNFAGAISDVRFDNVRGCYVQLCVDAEPNSRIHISAIYAPNDPAQRRELFEQLHMDIPHFNDDFIHFSFILGDFNCINDPRLDKVGGNVDRGTDGALELLGWTSAVDSIDIWRTLNPATVATTWRQGRIGTRIDKIFVPRSLRHGASADIVSFPMSDHDAVTCTVSLSPVHIGKGYWKLNTSVLKRDDYILQIQHIIADLQRNMPRSPAGQAWEIFKKRVKATSIRYCTDLAVLHKADMTVAQQRHSDAVAAWTGNPSDDNTDAVTTTRHQLDELMLHKYEAAAVRSRATWLVQGEKSTRYFCQLEKQRQHSTSIPELVHPISGDACSTPVQLCDAAALCYERLYTPERTSDQLATERLMQHLPRLSEQQSADCERELSLAELTEALDSSPSNKTPGLDGIPKEFYQAFWHDLGPIMLGMFNSSLTRVKSSNCRQ